MKTILFILCFMVQALALNAQQLLPPLKFKTGQATVSAHFSSDNPQETLTLHVVVKSPFKEQPDFYSVPLTKESTASSSIPLETENALCSMAITGREEPYVIGLAGLSQTTATHLNITDKNGALTVTVTDLLKITEQERWSFAKANDRFNAATPGLTGLDREAYKKTLPDYVKWQMDSILPQRIQYASGKLTFTPALKHFLSNSLRIQYASGRMFFYKQDAARHFKMTVPEPPLSYYSFLQHLDLAPEQSLYETNFYPKFMTRFLKIPAFNIPPIGDSPVKTWIEAVKKNVSKATGTQKPSFYDILAIYAYLNDSQPLSEQQKVNISNYYTGEKAAMGTALLHYYAMKDSIESNVRPVLHIQPAPKVNDGDLLQAILSNYAGKTVLVDIWGTWCQPCLMAHKAMAATKAKLMKQGVVFVYLADTSSPKQKWLEIIKEIGGEHYYLTRNQVNAIFNQYDEKTNPYPFYLIFDQAHKLKQKFAGFPGTEAIEQALTR